MNIDEMTRLIIKELKAINQDVNLDSVSSENIAKIGLFESNNKKIVGENTDELYTKIENLKNEQRDFLLALQERILVLFEGLSNFDRGDIEARVELSLKFMEFLLATIDNRLKHL